MYVTLGKNFTEVAFFIFSHEIFWKHEIVHIDNLICYWNCVIDNPEHYWVRVFVGMYVNTLSVLQSPVCDLFDQLCQRVNKIDLVLRTGVRTWHLGQSTKLQNAINKANVITQPACFNHCILLQQRIFRLKNTSNKWWAQRWVGHLSHPTF